MSTILYYYNNLQAYIKDIGETTIPFAKKDPSCQTTIKYLPHIKSENDIKNSLESVVGSIQIERPKEYFIDIKTHTYYQVEPSYNTLWHE